MSAHPSALPDELETRIRILVADHLGVGAEDLAPEVSLLDDLAADSLDLVEIALAIEGAIGVVLPQHFLDEVRTCGELIAATVALSRRSLRHETAAAECPVPLRARITPAGSPRAWIVERVLLLTPYAAESLADDALRAGAGGRLELSLTPRATNATLARVRAQFSRLCERGIEVEVRRDGGTRSNAA
jgi:acyl carrier protein